MKIEQKKFYRIRHTPTGKFKLGGMNSNFGKIGKLWRGATIKAHLQQFLYYFKRRDLDVVTSVQKGWERFSSWRKPNENLDINDCEIVEYELIEKRSQPLADFLVEEMNKKPL